MKINTIVSNMSKGEKMNAKLAIASVVFAVFISSMATTLAQPVPYEQYPSGPDYPGPDYPSDPNYPGPDYPNYPTDPYNPWPQQGSGPVTVPGSSSGNEGHPSNGPSSSQPISAPSGSNTDALNY